MRRNKSLIFLLCNIAIMLFEIIGIGMSYNSIGPITFIYYTQLSNILLLVASIANIFFTARAIRRKKKIPQAVWQLFHAAVSATTVTFLVVVFVLSWMYESLLLVLTYESMLYTHTICPLLGIASFLIFAPKNFRRKAVLCSVSFTILYAIVSISMNILRIWEGPYPFLRVYDQPIWASVAWCIGIVGGAYGISRVLLIGRIKK